MIIKSVTFDRANRKADKSISISFTTALEQSSDELKEFDDSLGSCILAIKPNESKFEYEDLNKLDSIDIAIPEKRYVDCYLEISKKTNPSIFSEYNEDAGWGRMGRLTCWRKAIEWAKTHQNG